MSRFLGLDFLGHRLLGVEIAEAGGAPDATLDWMLPAELNLENANVLGDLLKEQLGAQRIQARDAVCLVGRKYVAIKTQRFPDCPDSELPSLVAFTDLSDCRIGGEQPLIDFEAGPAVDGERDVTLAVADQSAILALSAMLKRAGVNLRAMAPRPYGLPRPAEMQNAAQVLLLVHLEPDNLEVSAWREGRLQLARTMGLGSEGAIDEKRLANEIRRTLMALEAQHASQHVERILVTGSALDSAAATIREVSKLSADAVTVRTLDATFPALWPAFGAANAGSRGAAWPVNFLAVKRPEPPKKPSRVIPILAGGIAAAVLLGAYFTLQRTLGERDKRITRLRNEVTQLSNDLRKRQPELQRHAALKAWVDGDVPWLDELVDLAGNMPDTSLLFVTNIDGAASSTGKAAQFKLTGRAQSQRHVIGMQTAWALEADEHFRVTPRGVNPIANVSAFPWRFQIDLSVTPLTAKEYDSRARELHASYRLSPFEKAGRREKLSARQIDTVSSSSESTQSVAAVAPAQSSETPSPSASSSSLTSTTSASNSAATADGGDLLSRKIEALRKLPPAEREKEIQKVPSFLRARLLEKLKE